MSTAPSVDPATHCPGCGEGIAEARARFCASCGRQLMRPDLRAHRIVADGAPSPASRRPEPPPDRAAVLLPLVAWPAPVAAPAEAGASNADRGLAGALGAAVVLVLLALTATVILAVARHDPPTPSVSQGAGAVTIATGP